MKEYLRPKAGFLFRLDIISCTWGSALNGCSRDAFMNRRQYGELMSERPGHTYIAPEWGKPSFNCPHCGAFAGQWWETFFVLDQVNDELDAVGHSGSKCHACKVRSIWRYWTTDDPWNPSSPPVERGELLWPTRSLAAVAPPDTSPEVRELWNEAASIVEASPRAASALLRLALETLLSEAFEGAANLNAMIGAAKQDGLPQTVVKAMDVLRFSGNAAIHEIRRQDTPETAAMLFMVLNRVIDRLVTEPRQIAELHDALPESVRDQIDRRDAPAEG